MFCDNTTPADNKSKKKANKWLLRCFILDENIFKDNKFGKAATFILAERSKYGIP
jgi:hypothetical protein